MERPPVKGQGEAPVWVVQAGASSSSAWSLISVSLATRGQTDMRGLVTAGRAFGRSVPRV